MQHSSLAAIGHYQTALQVLAEAKTDRQVAVVVRHARTIRYNLAIVYYKSHRLDEARAEFQQIVNTAPLDSVEAQQSSYYLLALEEEAAEADQPPTNIPEATQAT